MTPEKKAKELIKRFTKEIEFNCQPSLVPMVAKMNSLILVDEVLQELCEANESKGYNNFSFWTAVKREIEKL